MRWILLALLAITIRQTESPRQGQDHALFFAVDDYSAVPGFNDLDNPIKNARAIAAELEEEYDFTTETLANPTLREMTKKLEEYQRRFARNGDLNPNGQLLIYLSGHGKEAFNAGFFLAADTRPGQLFQTAFSYDLYRNFIDAIPCKHILVAIDACHSAHFDPNFKNRNDRTFGRKNELTETEKLLEDHRKYQARFFFTSDATGDETPDKSGFAKKFLEALRTHRSADGFLTSSELYASYLKRARPQPGGGEFGRDEAGSSFLFFKKAIQPIDVGDVSQREKDLQAWQQATRTNSISVYQTYLRSYPRGLFRAQANEKVRELADQTDWNIAQAQNTPTAYKEYLTRHPDGKYEREARKRTDGDPGPEELPDMVFIEGGTFDMGDQFGDGHDDEDLHTVTLSDYYLGRHEVTFAEYASYCAATGRSLPDDEGWGKGKRPVINVSWYDAVAYCNWRSEQESLRPVYQISGSEVTANWDANGYRLPMEAEWEYAARSRGRKEKWAGTSSESNLSNYGNFCDNNCTLSWKKEDQDDGYENTAPVGSFRPNDLGLYDMSGNVWEWCWDWYDSDYYSASDGATDPRGPDRGSLRVNRGGSWFSTPGCCRAAFRYYGYPTFSFYGIGFRLARSSSR